MKTYPLDLPGLFKNRRLLIEEGQRRGYSFLRLDPIKHIFRVEKEGKGFLFRYFPSYVQVHKRFPHIEDKDCEKNMMHAIGMYTPKTYLTIKAEEENIDIPQHVTYPVVAKPIDGSLGKNVFINLNNEKALQKALETIRSEGSDSLVEEMISIEHAREYRIIAIEGKVVACTERRPASIVGNSKNTIVELVKLRNQEPLRGPTDSRGYTLHYLPEEAEYSSFLAKNNFSVDDIPSSGERVFLDHRVTSVFGADLIDRTNEIDHSFVSLCEKFVQKNNFFIVGFDVIAEDIAHQTDKQTYFFNEFNMRPFFDINECVNYGEGVPISSLIWEAIEKHSNTIMTKEFSEF